MDRSREARESTTQQVVWLSILVILICSFAVRAQAQQCLQTDREALEMFMGAVDPTGELLPWVSGTNPCTWIGVECYQNRVTSLRIPGLYLTGALPANTLADLDQLRVLSLHHNQFSGTFPIELARCTLLQRLFLDYNLFSGPLPHFTGIWPRMTHFSVGFNNLSGELPATINALKSLNVLNLQGNSFSGEISALSFEHLLNFSVANNSLVGPVPIALENFPASDFAGNAGLCGPPTENLCPGKFFANAMAPVAPAPAPQTSPPMDNGTSLITTASSQKNHTKLVSAGVVVIIAIAVVAVAILLIYFLCRPHDTNSFDESHVGKPARDYSVVGAEFYHGDGAGHLKDDYAVTISNKPQHEKLVFLNKQQREPFALEELMRASAVALRKGCVGTSYRADLGGFVVVVKRLKDVSDDRKSFESCVQIIGGLRHRHLLPLRAYYFSKDEKLLVTDYMPQGSLQTLLHGDGDGESRIHVDWITRVKIILGTAKALAYLHKKLPHGNIRSSNVLLSRDLEPILSDYALTPLLTPAIVAVSRFMGYRAPEISDIREITLESDVYSFGVVLLEILTGQTPIQDCNKCLDLPKWAMSVVRDKRTSELFDVRLLRDNVEDEMQQMLQLALTCMDSMPNRRPKMLEVVLLLHDITGGDDSFRRSDAPKPRHKSKPCAPILVPPLPEF